MDSNLYLLLQSALSGLLFGSVFGIMAMGLSLVWGILRIANFAQLSLALLGAYLSYTLITQFAVDPLLTLVVIVPPFFVLGMAMQWLFQRFRVTTFTSILLTFGLFIVMENVITFLWSADIVTTRQVIDRSYRQAIKLPPPFEQFFVFPPDLLAFIAAVLLAGLTYVLLRHTYWGKSVRAMAQDPAVAQAFGIPYRRQALLLSGLATTFAGVAGVFIAMKTPMYPSLPLSWIGVVIASVIIGGLGNPLGAVIAACSLKMIEAIWSVSNPPGWAPLISFSVLILYLLIQPNTLIRNWQARREALAKLRLSDESSNA